MTTSPDQHRGPQRSELEAIRDANANIPQHDPFADDPNVREPFEDDRDAAVEAAAWRPELLAAALDEPAAAAFPARLHDAVVDYQRRGWHLFPTGGRDMKLPAAGIKWGSAATNDLASLLEWFDAAEDSVGVGVACGPSRLVVVDVDSYKAEAEESLRWLAENDFDLPPTLTAETASGGKHFYYQASASHTLGNTAAGLPGVERKLPGIDFRADGGYVVAPPTRRRDGSEYRFTNEQEPAACPDWLTTAQRSPRTERDLTPPTDNRNALKRLAGFAKHLAEKPEGERHSALYTIARTLGQLAASGHLTRDEIHAQLYDAAHRNGLLAEDGGHNITQTINDGIDKGIEDGPDLDHHEPGDSIPYTLPPLEAGVLGQPDGYVLRAASTIRTEAVEWYYPGRIPLGSITLLVGPAGLGKTTFACALAAKGTRGDLDGPAADVIFVSAEDAEAHTLVPRFTVAGADLDRVHFMKILEPDGFEAGLTLPEDTTKLQAAVEKTGAKLIILDPVVGHLSGNIDSHKDHSVRRALAPLAALAESTGAAILGIGHLNKSSSTDVLTRLGGSIGFGAAARSVLLLGEDPKAPEGSPERLLIHGKSNLSPLAVPVRLKIETRPFVTTEGKDTETSGIEWMGEDLAATATKVLAGRQEPTKMEVATDFLREVLANGPLPRDEVRALAAEEEITPATLQRAAKKLGIESDRKEFGTWSPWSLPPPRLITRLTFQNNETRESAETGKTNEGKGSSTRLIGTEQMSHVDTRLIAKGEPCDEPSEGGEGGAEAPQPPPSQQTSTTHGTRYAYRSRGCRCDECIAWETARKRAQYRRRQGNRDEPRDEPSDGSEAGSAGHGEPTLEDAEATLFEELGAEEVDELPTPW